MAPVIYKDHTIIASGKPDGAADDPAGFVPVAVIAWSRPDRQRRVMHILKSTTLYARAEEAQVAALKNAKAWVDFHTER
jgi:hypothetical protein